MVYFVFVFLRHIITLFPRVRSLSLSLSLFHSLTFPGFHKVIDVLAADVIPARDVTARPLSSRQSSSAAPTSVSDIICYDNCTGSRCHDRVKFKTLYACVQMPPRTCSSIPVRSLQARHGACSSEIICDV